MLLSHLGAKYTSNNRTVETVETNIDCQFLGKKTKLRIAKQMPKEHTRHSLKYRGQSYEA